MGKIIRKRNGIITDIDSGAKALTIAGLQAEVTANPYLPGVHVGDVLHESFFDKDGTLKHDGYIKKEILWLPRHQ